MIKELCPDLPAVYLSDRQGRQAVWNIENLPSDENKFYTYVLICENGCLYKGFTNNLKARFKRHCDGDGAEYTKKYKPLGVVYFESFDTEKEAVEREKYFKSGCGREWLKGKISEVIYERNK
ncbi:GIY-YIG nuclease family protein [Fibrobacter intestinalis]|uniref:GIY-YIG nuclease family protein n=1 Tax=Fibrobacter TaxID=832 RepID=UPI0018E93F8A|nr:MULTISPECIES: GIY-YIG nuclease family protein [Fibrobacter]